MCQPKISIITIAFNSVQTIEDTIQSVLSQSYSGIEYIVVDGGSTDGTKKIIEKYSGSIHKYISESDEGIYDAMNKGVGLATGDIIGILNSDDVYAGNDVVAKIAQTIQGFDALYGDLVYVKRNNISHVTRYWKSGKYVRDSFLKGWMPPHPTFYLRRACYEEYGAYTLALKSAADYELMLRMLYKNKLTAVYLPEIMVKMRLGGQSNLSIKNRIVANREDAQAWKMNNIKPHLFTLILKPLSKLTQFINKDK